MKSRKDEELIRLCAAGNVRAFDELYSRYSVRLVNFVNRIIKDFPRAEDIFQETFLRVMENAGKFNFNYKFSTWIYRIALNLSLNEIKRRRLQAAPAYIDSEEEYHAIFQNARDADDPHTIMEKKEYGYRLSAALNKLSPQHRIAFILKFQQGLLYQEIAQVTETNIGTVKSRIHYALNHLRELMEHSS